MNLVRRLERIAAHADNLTDRARRKLRRLRPARGPLVIVPYAGYGSAERLLVHGRVLRDPGAGAQGPTDSRWRNLVELYKRIESDEVPGARVRIRFAGQEEVIEADPEGYFGHRMALPRPLDSSGWHQAAVELVEPAPSAGTRVQASAPVLVPPTGAHFGVISDIDDTMLWSNVTSRLRMLRLVARSNAHTRRPFKGVAALYRALHDGARGNEGNPIFYVSGSPWNLYPPLVEFLRANGLPEGPLLLKDFGEHTLFSSAQAVHKLRHIEAILQAFPELPFVLIGDSGEKDPEIYTQVVHDHPNRIRAIYIRSIDPDPARIEAIDRLIGEVRASGAQLVLAPDSEFAAAHAAAEGLISAHGLEAVRSDKQAAESPGDSAPPL